MTSSGRKTVQALALLAALALPQVFVQANALGRHVSPRFALVPLPIAGKLTTSQNKSILVNGNSVKSGTTILSGTQITTPAQVGATIDLGPLGRLDVAPDTKLTLTFTETSVTVELEKGHVALTTNKGVNGMVKTAEGMISRTDPSRVSTVVAKTAGVQGASRAGVGVVGAGVGLSAGGAAAAGAAGVGFATGTTAVSRKMRGRGSNPSPSVP